MARRTTPEVLFDSLYELMQKQSITSITVQSIVNHCGVTKPTFYHYFRDKYQLMNWGIIQRFFLPSFSFQGNRLDWRETTHGFLLTIVSNLDFFRNAFAYSGQNSLVEALAALGLEQTRRDAERFGLSDSIMQDEILFALDMCCTSFFVRIQKWVIEGAKESPDELAYKMMLCIPPIVEKLFYLENKGKSIKRV